MSVEVAVVPLLRPWDFGDFGLGVLEDRVKKWSNFISKIFTNEMETFLDSVASFLAMVDV